MTQDQRTLPTVMMKITQNPKNLTDVLLNTNRLELGQRKIKPMLRRKWWSKYFRKYMSDCLHKTDKTTKGIWQVVDS